MRFQDQVVRSTQKALDDICRAALAIPDDKAAWLPMGDARSVLGQMQEIAGAAEWILPILKEAKAPEFIGHAARETARVGASFSSIRECVEAAKASTTALCKAISAFPEDRLDEEIRLPFGVMTFSDLLGLHAWNMVYHLGQINQIGLMLGDRQMH